jgi:uncharacterized SAM-binding protein YcdF (DUF218 family)
MNEIDELAQKLLDYMRLDMPVHKSDVIVGMGTLDNRVAERSAQLFLDGLADLLVFTGGFGRITKNRHTTSEAERFRDIAISMGVPVDKIVIETESSNTGDNIVFTQRLLASRLDDLHSVIFVTKPYMERRVRATFKKQWVGRQPEMIVTSPQFTYEEYFNEVISKDLFLNVLVSDVQRVKIYVERGYQAQEEIPQDVWDAYERLVELGYDKQLTA